MADVQNGASLPRSAVGSTSESKNQNAPSTTQNNDQSKRNPRHRKNHSQSLPPTDGTVSDSMANKVASPRSKKGPKPRQQSAAVGAIPSQNGNTAQQNGHKPRHASVGGSMLPATPFKEQAYAGPTFQASPAPSSLPVPKFFSKSVPNVAAHQSLEARMAGEKTPEQEHSSPESDPVSQTRATQQTPLDMFFKADKAEKEEKRRSGSMLSPEMAARQISPANSRTSWQQSGKSSFLRELDSDNEPMLSPKTVPQNQRPPLTHRASSSPGLKAADADSESEKEAYTQNLKDLLFNNINSPPRQRLMPPHNQQRAHSNPRDTENMFHTPSPFQRSTSGPSTPTPSEQQNHYSLHYGNRNLSPLFKAARGETPARPSGLRQQELASDLSPTTNYHPNVPPESQQPPQIEPNSFSRNYLDHQIQTNRPATLPQLPYSNGNAPNSNMNYTRPVSDSASQRGVVQPGDSGSGSGSSASPRTGGASHDIRTMEDDLRRMLNLNVLSG